MIVNSASWPHAPTSEEQRATVQQGVEKQQPKRDHRDDREGEKAHAHVEATLELAEHAGWRLSGGDVGPNAGT
jgi:hypothetical protein